MNNVMIPLMSMLFGARLPRVVTGLSEVLAATLGRWLVSIAKQSVKIILV